MPIPTVREVFSRLGYDIDNPNDMRNLAENIQWVSEERERKEKWRAGRLAYLGSAIIALFSAIVTIFGEWLMRKSTTGQ